MFEITVKSELEEAHFIKNYAGKCAQLHGHNWTVEAIVCGETLNELGILVDFKILKDELNKVLDLLDHKYLNELEMFAEKNPTAEIIAQEIFNRLSVAEIFDGAAKLKGIRVYETPKSCVTYLP